MQKNITTLGKVFDRVDHMSADCYDRHVDVPEILFDNLDTVRVSGEAHSLRPLAQRSISNRLGIPYPYLRRCPARTYRQMNLNHWIREEKNDQFVVSIRWAGCKGPFLRENIFLSIILKCLSGLDSLGYGPDIEVQCHLDAEFMSLSIS